MGSSIDSFCCCGEKHYKNAQDVLTDHYQRPEKSVRSTACGKVGKSAMVIFTM